MPHGQSELEPFNETARWCGNDWPKLGLTMVGFERLKNVAQLLIDVIANKVPGAFAELGVWRGGTCIFAKLLFDAMAEPRAVHVFDAFARIASYAKASQDFLSVKEDNIPKWFKLYGAYDRNVHIHKGLFRDTLPAFRENASHAGAKIAVLRVDGNHHDSYQDALYNLYGLVPVGGYVIFDDVQSHQGAMQAWREFKRDQGLPETLQPIDHHSAYFKKTRDITVNFNKKRRSVDVNLKP